MVEKPRREAGWIG